MNTLNNSCTVLLLHEYTIDSNHFITLSLFRFYFYLNELVNV